MTLAHRPHRWTREDYERVVEAGVFGPEDRVELIDGEVLDMSPQNSPHFTAIRLTEDAMRDAFGAGFEVRTQGPLALTDDSEPEPDVAVVEGSPRDYAHAHPRTALLIVEVADTSLPFDRGRKRGLYARAEVPEYWILDLTNRTLEVYRQPRNGEYTWARMFSEGDSLAPLAASGPPVPVADFLP